ncbi:hypothetical protein [Streptacidiphilus sp. EB103A]|uniref:hypothetical protein n=1 Tax=Streptacidiphilus sp. EB103A TaxID=3156275 RepID=UPI0035151351
MAAYITSEETADQQIRLLLERILQTGAIARDGTRVRARSHKTDSGSTHRYVFYLDDDCRRVAGFHGPPESWFEQLVRIPLEDLLGRLEEARLQQRAAQLRREEQLRTAEERASRKKEATRAAVPKPTWPLLPVGAYDQNGLAVPVPIPRRPITDEARLRHVAYLNHVVFHADVLNSAFLRDVPVEERHEAMRAVLIRLLRTPRTSVALDRTGITATGSRNGRTIVLTFTPDGAMVRALKAGQTMMTRYQARYWKLPEPRNAQQPETGTVEPARERLSVPAAASQDA